MHNPYKTRQGGATVTVFVPYDCPNNCPFCVNKAEYANAKDFSLEKICNSIRTINEITPYCDFVFTGGEPLANLDGLYTMLSFIPTTHKVYINTSLPAQKDGGEQLLTFLNKQKDKITCINVSRHLRHFVQEAPDEILSKLPIPFRINCVLFDDYPKEKLLPFIERFKGIPGANIQLRFDYTKTTPENLYDEDDDPIIADVKKFAKFTGLDGCRMRCGFHYDYDGLSIVYHKTLPYSTIKEVDPEDGKEYDILYDILIKQNGDFHSDWNDTVTKDLILDLDAYRNVKYEPYDLRWIK